MRIVIDLQGAQGGSRFRGIGRYSLSLAQAMVRNRGEHEIIIALNGMFPDSIEPIRASFDGLLSQDNIQVWHATNPSCPLDPANRWRRHAAELVREAFLTSLQPDIVHITSLFEGFADDAIHSIGLNPAAIPTAVTLYDLIPLIHSETYLQPNPTYEAFYREKLDYLKRADIYLAISESSRQEGIKYLDATPEQVVDIGAATEPHFRQVRISNTDEHSLRNQFGLTRPFLMYSGASDERKNHLRLIKAFSMLPPSKRDGYQLAIVGGLPNEHREKFESYAKLCGLSSSDVVITGKVSDEEMVKFYNLCDLFIFPSLHEGFGLPALEAMSCGAPVIGSNITSLPQVIGRTDALFDPFDEIAIAQKISEVLTNDHLRHELVQHGLKQVKKFSWDNSAKTAIAAFERLHVRLHRENVAIERDNSSLVSTSWLVERIAKLNDPPLEERDWLKIAQAIALNSQESSKKQMLVDISELVQRDAKSGIQRVVRSILTELLNNPPQGFRVELVYATPHETGYRYARKFTQRFFGRQEQAVEDEFVDTFNGDVFLGLDFQPHVVLQQAAYYAQLQRIGVLVYFVVYDLLPVLLPKVFPEGASTLHVQWLATLARTDGVLCISRAVADEMVEWLSVFGYERLRPFKLGWFHLGADVSCSVPTKGLPADASAVLKILSKRPTFLSVGTIEPRKGQRQTLMAFERLWAQGVDVNLVMVGKHGWNVDMLVELLRNHSELNRRLFWLEGISDEYLEKIYAASSCLIAASEGEGFGLPLIEAAQHQKPIIARDIPVFREVAGSYATYFAGLSPDALVETVRDWLALDRAGQAPQSNDMPWLTWKQCTQNMLDVMLGGQWYRQWKPDGIHRYWGSDARLGTQVGKRDGRDIATTGQAGYLIFGPYIPLPAGQYQVAIRGELSKTEFAGARMDVVIDKATHVLGEAAFGELNADSCLIILPISLEMPCTDLEIRVWVGDATEMRISMIEIVPCQDGQKPNDTDRAVAIELFQHGEAASQTIKIKSLMQKSGVAFGTSGTRGLVAQMTDEVCGAYVTAFLAVVARTFHYKRVALGMDLRPSSPGIAAACTQAIRAAGLQVDFCGALPTPALALYAQNEQIPAVMVTGSHIPFDRNGIKFYRPDGEISKADESAIIDSQVELMIGNVPEGLLPVNPCAIDAYEQRYADFFPAGMLAGLRLGLYEHSSVARDPLRRILEKLGAEVVSLGRTDTFVPIDTEAVSADDIRRGREWSAEYGFDAIISTDGDGDRPLISDEHGNWLRGDIVGLLCARYLGVQSLAVPVSCNTAIEQCGAFESVVRTKIGSPYVISGMQQFDGSGKAVAGFEANGGFLLGAELHRAHQVLAPLPTRDAVLPVLAVLAAAQEANVSISTLVGALPGRYTASDRLQNFSIETSKRLIETWANEPAVFRAFFGDEFGIAVKHDLTDGLRFTLDNRNVVHLRPSGNAPELRCYCEASTPEMAETMTKAVLDRVAQAIDSGF